MTPFVFIVCSVQIFTKANACTHANWLSLPSYYTKTNLESSPNNIYFINYEKNFVNMYDQITCQGNAI